jgi:hypothetical protein
MRRPAPLDRSLSVRRDGGGVLVVYEWSFRLGPGFVVGIGGPLIIIAGVLVMFDVIEGGGPVQGLMWPLGLDRRRTSS